MKRSPVKAIRCKCLGCQGDSPSQVRLCNDVDCSLYPYRMGKNPARAGIGGRKGGFSTKSASQVGVLVDNNPPPIQVSLPAEMEAGNHA